ncbi:unnamed protein product [Thelazia callipaeda]|uniref:SNR27 n=1 Tax=Thelazia callipaeda TaxID=103827 RepID=A0A0N5CNW3_THECL|nr:unnamed protein product [Thelazia callipaeda]
MVLKFNHAFVLQKLSTQRLRDDKSSLEMVTGAVNDLRTAARIFEYISRNKDDTMGQARLVSRTVSAHEARACYDFLTQAQTYLQRAKAQDEEDQRQRQRQEEERQALRRQQEQEVKEREEKARKELEALKQMRQEYVEKTKEILRLPKIVEEKRARRSGSVKRRKDREGDEFVNDDSDLGDWKSSEGGETRKKKEKRGRKKRDRREVSSAGSGGELDEAERRHRRENRKSKKMRYDRTDFEISAKQKMKVKSREFVQSDESSSDEDIVRSKSQIQDLSDDATSSVNRQITRSDSNDEDSTRQVETDDDSDGDHPKIKRRAARSTSDQIDSSSSSEDRARSPSESNSDSQVQETPVKAVRRRRILSSDEESEKNVDIGEINEENKDNDDEEGGFEIGDDD